MSDRVGRTELAGLLTETAARHHQAFAASDGADPEWAAWYAGDLQALVWDRLGGLPTRSELVYLLIGAERAFRVSGRPAGEWPDAYAGFLLDNFPS